MKYIYLISATGAARTQSKTLARDYEMTGYRKCTPEEFLQKIQKMRTLEPATSPATSTRGGTRSGLQAALGLE